MTGLLLSAYEAGRIDLPAHEVKTLAAADLATAGRHRQLWQVLTNALSALEGVGIEALAIKGVTNEARWYSRMGERPCADVDLVLAPSSIDRVDEALAVLAPDHPFSDQATSLVRRRQLQHVHFVIGDVAVDLHLDPLKLGIWTGHPELWWSTSTTIDGPRGSSVRVLAPELALISALTHLNKDRYAYLGAYAEVALISGDPSLDWDRVARFASAEGLEAPVWASYAEVDRVLGLGRAVPTASGWRRWAWDRAWPPASRLRGHDGRASARKRQMMIPLLTRGRAGEAVAEWRRSMFPPRELIEVHGDSFAGHGYLRRITIDRMANR